MDSSTSFFPTGIRCGLRFIGHALVLGDFRRAGRKPLKAKRKGKADAEEAKEARALLKDLEQDAKKNPGTE
jgi:hypothetical protein